MCGRLILLNGFFVCLSSDSIEVWYVVSERCDNMKRKVKEFLKKKKVAAGCVAAAAVIAAGSFAMVMQPSDIPELSSYTDPVIETTLTGDDTPLASKPKVTTKTTSKTKTTRKKVKLKKASSKSYTKKLPNKKKSTTQTKKKGKTTVKTQTTVQTATSEKYTKKSKQKVVTEKVVTTVKTTTTVAATQSVSASNSTVKVSTSSSNTASQKATKHTVSNVASIAPKMDSRVLNAYARMGFAVTVDPSAAYAGHFDARSRSITLQEEDETVYHELGHFLAFIAGNVDQSRAFASVYSSEKSKFTGYNKAYATQNASEYFAESVKDYMLNGAALSSQRPNTYKAIQSALDTVTTARADAILKAYSAIWK